MVRLAVPLLLLALSVGGCASSPSAVRLTEMGPPLSANWIFQGRIGIQAGEQSLSGQVHWRHRVDADVLLMSSPLGQGVARIERNTDGVTLEVPNQPPRHAPDAESLTHEVLGYGLPVSGLAWWMQARPAPDRVFEATHDAAGRIVRLKQDGWVIDYLQYSAEAPRWPRKLVVSREGLEIRLVADNWQSE